MSTRFPSYLRSRYAPALSFGLRLLLHALFLVLAALAASYVTFVYMVPRVGDHPGAAVAAPPIFLAVYLACLFVEAAARKVYAEEPFLGPYVRSSVAFLVAFAAQLALMIWTKLLAVTWPLAPLAIFLVFESAAEALLKAGSRGLACLWSRGWGRRRR